MYQFVELQSNAITYEYTEYVIAHNVFNTYYFKIPFLELRKRYYENPAWYKAIQNQFVGRLYNMFSKNRKML